MDRIELRGLRAVGVHGVLPAERERAQPFEIDLDLDVDLQDAGVTDDLADTVDYGIVADVAVRIVAEESHRLLERLAARVAEDVLVVDGRIASVAVTVRKLRPPLAVDVATVGVRVRRARP